MDTFIIQLSTDQLYNKFEKNNENYKKIMNHLYIAVGSIRQNVKICDIGNKILRTFTPIPTRNLSSLNAGTQYFWKHKCFIETTNWLYGCMAIRVGG